MKSCSHCKSEAPEFYKNSGFKDGLDSCCKECKKKASKAYEKANKLKINKRKAEYRKSPHVKKQRKRYYLEYRSKMSETDKQRQKLVSKAWLKKSGKGPLYCQKRRAKRAQVEESFTQKDRDSTMLVFGYRCFNCQSSVQLQIDHHYPLDRGFPLEPSNAVVLCKSCNSGKGNKLPQDFYSKEQLRKLEWILTVVGGPF